jgi:hypothetical protein
VTHAQALRYAAAVVEERLHLLETVCEAPAKMNVFATVAVTSTNDFSSGIKSNSDEMNTVNN